MARRSNATATVKETLTDLGIDDEEQQVEHESESDEEVDETDGDEGGEEEESDEAVFNALTSAGREEPVAAPKSKLRSALFDPGARPSARAGAPPAPPQVVEPASPLPQYAEPESQVYVMPQERVRKQKPQTPPSVRKLGNALSRKLPGAERVRVKKRMDNGQLGFIGEYSAQDLAACTDIETFIARYIKPKYGPGTYKLTGIDAGGNELDAGEIPMLDPLEPNENQGVVGLMSMMLEQQQRAQRELIEATRMNQPAPLPTMDPIAMLRGLHEVNKDMQPAPSNNNSDMASMFGMMMASMQAQQQQAAQQQQQMTQLLVAALQPREDPTMKILLAKLVEERASPKSSGDSIPIPAPPPPESPLKGLKEIVEVMAVMMAGKSGGADAELKEMVKTALTARDGERLSPRDVITLMHEMQQSRGTDDFRKSMENMSMVMQVANNLRNQGGESSSATFFDALAALFSNRDFAGSIASTIRAKTEAAARQQELAAQQQMLRERRALLHDVRKGAPAGTPLGPTGAPQAVQPGVRVPGMDPFEASVAAAPVRAPAPAPIPAPSPAASAVSEAPAAVQEVAYAHVETAEGSADVEVVKTKPLPRLPRLPAATGEHLAKIVAAVDDAQLIERVVHLLIYFAEFDDWRPLTEMLLSLVKRGEKKKAVKTLRNIVEGLSAMAMMQPVLAHRIVTAFEEHFDEIQNELGDIQIEESGGDNPFEEALADEDEAEDEDGDEDEEGDEDGELVEGDDEEEDDGDDDD